MRSWGSNVFGQLGITTGTGMSAFAKLAEKEWFDGTNIIRVLMTGMTAIYAGKYVVY